MTTAVGFQWARQYTLIEGGLVPFLRQTVNTQKSANGVKIPLKRGWNSGFGSTAVQEGIPAGPPAGGLEMAASVTPVEPAFASPAVVGIDRVRIPADERARI
jgi:hypothetical protein